MGAAHAPVLPFQTGGLEPAACSHNHLGRRKARAVVAPELDLPEVRHPVRDDVANLVAHAEEVSRERLAGRILVDFVFLLATPGLSDKLLDSKAHVTAGQLECDGTGTCRPLSKKKTH